MVKLYWWKGGRRTVRELSELAGIDLMALRYRLAAGWPVERAMSEPVAARNNRADKKCLRCDASIPGPKSRRYCSDKCRDAARREKCTKRELERHGHMTLSEAEQALEWAVRVESLPPWCRHPAPQTGVVVRRAQ